jgi:GalNAc-alpha-(1->4)-GalNAc-alpha-(1->3)-diNAcBac-PP-undecaprenol alpha-1,4-N-acetyl-D-galactosaminyltransferase
VISSLDCGGAERVASILSGEWINQQHEVEIVRYSEQSITPFYAIDPRVKITSLDLQRVSTSVWQAIRNNARRALSLRKAILQSRPDIVLSYMLDTSVSTIVALTGTGLPVIVTDHADPISYPVSRIWSALRSWVYPRAKRVVVLNESAKQWFSQHCRGSFEVLGNPIPQPSTTPTRDLNSKSKTLISVGRLDYLKGMDCAIHGFAEVANDFPNWRFVICGDGVQRDSLEALGKSLNLEQRIVFKGIVEDIYTELCQADLFVLSSRSEAFPMALCEAMSAGLYVVATRFNQEVEKFIPGQTIGEIVEVDDIQMLKSALSRAMSDDATRNAGGKKGRALMEAYAPVRIAEQWLQLFKSVTG